MNWVRKLVLIGFILKSATGCTAVDVLAIAFLVEDFAKGVMLLSKVIKGDFALAENVNSRAFRNNLKFQLETGGNFDVTQQPMYSNADLAARAALLNNLTQYAQSLANAASDGHAAAPRVHYAEPVNLERLDVSHSLDLPGIAELQHGLEFFKRIFELPEREARLAAIVASGGNAVEKAAKLLYLDLGAKSDQVKACSYAAPKVNSLRKIHNLILCRGGLRGLLKSVIEKELVVWKKRLSFTRQPKATSLETKDKHLIGKLISTQKSGRQVDQMILQTQVAIKKMVSSHDQIVQMLKHPDRDNTASDFFAPQAFLEVVTVLTERAKWIARLIDEGTNQSTATIDTSNSAIIKHTD